MSFATVALALAVVAPAAPSRAPAASTFDEAACAVVQAAEGAESGGWERAAVGETAPPAALFVHEEACLPQAAAAADCDVSLVSVGVAELFVRCDMPRIQDIFAPRPHLGRPHGDRHAPRLRLTSDDAAPLASATPDHEGTLAMLAAAPVVLPPIVRGAQFGALLAPRGATAADELLRPPRA